MTSFVTKINQSKLSIWIWMDLRKHSTDTCFLLLNNSKWMLQTCKSSTYTRTETKLIHQRHVQFHTKKKIEPLIVPIKCRIGYLWYDQHVHQHGIWRIITICCESICSKYLYSRITPTLQFWTYLLSQRYTCIFFFK